MKRKRAVRLLFGLACTYADRQLAFFGGDDITWYRYASKFVHIAVANAHHLGYTPRSVHRDVLAAIAAIGTPLALVNVITPTNPWFKFIDDVTWRLSDRGAHGD